MTIAAFLNTKLAILKRHYFPELITLFVVFGVVGVFVSIYASTNRTNLPIPYQGRLLDSNYIPVADGTHYMKFAIYTAATGTSSCVWESGSGTGANNCNSGTSSSTPVTVNRGLFTALLGDTSTNNPALPATSFNFETNAYYLGVTACGTSNSCDAQMTPRRQIGGVPYAYNADLLDGNDSSAFVVAGGTLSYTQTTNALTIDVSSQTSSTALSLLGPTGASAGKTAPMININSNLGSLQTGLISITNTMNSTDSTTTPANIYISTTHGNTGVNGNTLYGMYALLTDSAVVSTATNGNTDYGTYLDVRRNGSSSSTGASTVYGSYIGAQSTGWGTSTVYGLMIDKPQNYYASGNDGNTHTTYGVYISNYDQPIQANGVTKKYGLYIEAQSGAGTNYDAIFAGGNVGIGTTTPTATLEVVSSSLTSGTGIKFTGPTSGTSMTGSALSLSSYIGKDGRLLNLSGTGSPASNGDTLSNAYSILSHAPSVTSTAYNIYSSTTDSTAYGNTVYGQYTNVEVSGNVNATKNAYGLYSSVDNRNMSTDQGTRNTYGGYFSVNGNTNGTATTYGVYSTIVAGAADTGYGFYTAIPGPGTTTNYGLYVDGTTGAGAKYGVYVDVGTTATTKYSGIFLNGNFGIGTSTPQALLTIAGALSGTPSSSTGAYFTFATSTYTDTGTASGGTATSSSFITFNQGVLASTNNVTTTNAYTIFVAGGPVKGTNNTSTNAIALGIGAGNVGTQINSYSLYVDTQTGATNNYAAAFVSGATSTGAVLIHATTTYGRLGQKLEVNQDQAEGGIAVNSWVSNTTAGILDFNKSKSTAVGTQTIVGNNDALGNIVFRGSDGSNFQSAASIASNVDGATISSTSMPGRLIFFTTASGSTSLSERMRIDNAGHIELSGTAPSSFSANCGTGPTASIAGTDMVGKITIGGSAIGQPCVVTFANTWTNAPSCIASNETTATSTRATSTATTLGLYNFAASDVISYICIGRR